MSTTVHKVEFRHGPADAPGLEALIRGPQVDPDTVIAVIGKTEGNGGVNDFTRILADRAYRDVLRGHGKCDEGAIRGIPMVWSGGTDGILCPHASVFCRVDESTAGLAVGVALSDEILPEEIGRVGMIEKVARGVELAMRDAGIERV